MAYELDNIDKKILYELDKNCRIPETRLAKIVGKSKESVRYRIKKLRSEGVIIGFQTYVNLSKLGFEAYKLYLKTRGKRALARSFVSHISGRPDVFWFGVGDGAWNMGLTFYVKDNATFFRVKNDLFSSFRELVVEDIVGTVVEVDSFGKKFLSAKGESAKASLVFGKRENNVIDRFSLDILNCLISDGRMKYVDIAARTLLSPDSVRTRIKVMERLGVISKYTLSIDSKKIGYELYKTFLYFEGLTKEQERRLFEIARKHPNVVNYLKVIAPWDIELEMMAENYHSYNGIINYFMEKFPEVLVKVETSAQELDVLFPSGKMPKAPFLNGD